MIKTLLSRTQGPKAAAAAAAAAAAGPISYWEEGSGDFMGGIYIQ